MQTGIVKYYLYFLSAVVLSVLLTYVNNYLALFYFCEYKRYLSLISGSLYIIIDNYLQ